MVIVVLTVGASRVVGRHARRYLGSLAFSDLLRHTRWLVERGSGKLDVGSNRSSRLGFSHMIDTLMTDPTSRLILYYFATGPPSRLPRAPLANPRAARVLRRFRFGTRKMDSSRRHLCAPPSKASWLHESTVRRRAKPRRHDLATRTVRNLFFFSLSRLLDAERRWGELGLGRDFNRWPARDVTLNTLGGRLGKTR